MTFKESRTKLMQHRDKTVRKGTGCQRACLTLGYLTTKRKETGKFYVIIWVQNVVEQFLLFSDEKVEERE
jgi:hypothetical protein